MKIAIFTDTYLPTVNGVSYAVESWKEELESRGHEVTVFCPSAGVKGDGRCKSVKIPFYEGYYTSIAPPINHDFSDYDAVQLNSFFVLGYYGFRVAQKHDLPLMSVVHTPISEYLDYVTKLSPLKRMLSFLYRHWEGRILKKSDMRVALSDYMESHITDIADGKSVERLTNGVNTRFFSPAKTDEFLSEHGIDSKKIIGYTGRLSSEKRVDELIKFAKEFDGEVLIGGDGPCRDEYEKLADTDNVTFLGFMNREKLPEFYSAIDLFVFPSRIENDPLTVLEANACGTPVIGADAAGLKNSIENGRNGFRYEPGDLEDMSEKIDEAYKNLETLHKKCLECSSEQSVSRTVDKFIEMYSESME